mgnify:CR=1 FL=1
MNPEANSAVNSNIIERLENLLLNNNDSQYGFHKAAEAMDDARLAGLFRDLARERSAHAAELQKWLMARGVKPRLEPLRTSALRRNLLDFLATLNGGDPAVILAEAERWEDDIEQHYESILQGDTVALDKATHDVLQRQYAAVVRTCDRVRRCRNAYERR